LLGKKIPYGCLSGSCGTCLIKIIEGEVAPASEVEKRTLVRILKDENPANHYRLSCRIKVAGDLHIEII